MVDARRAAGVLAAACLLVLCGCSPDQPADPSPSPTPVVQTPTETAQERQQRLDYAAAEAAYRTFRGEYNRVLRAGGARQPTKLMKATAGGQYLRELSQITSGYKTNHARDLGMENIVYVHHGGYFPSSILLDVCEDGRGISSTVCKNKLSGEVRTAHLQVKRNVTFGRSGPGQERR